ncbi:MAG: hypothetical protein ACPGVO_05005 [Spirulinaceae cyanobacterium]
MLRTLFEIEVVGDTGHWGTEQWLSLPTGNESVTPPLLVNADQKTPVLNTMLNGTSTNEIQTLSSLLLQDRYAYLDADFGTTYIPEDATDEKQIQFLIDAAEGVELATATQVFEWYWA